MRLCLALPCRAISDAVLVEPHLPVAKTPFLVRANIFCLSSSCSGLFPAEYLRQGLADVSIAAPVPSSSFPPSSPPSPPPLRPLSTTGLEHHHHHHPPAQPGRDQETRGGVPPSHAGPMMPRLSPSASTPQPPVPSYPRHCYRWSSRRRSRLVMFQVQGREGPQMVGAQRVEPSKKSP